MFKLKSKLIIAVVVMFGITAFISCEKENIIMLSSSQKNTLSEKSERAWGIHRKWDFLSEQCVPVVESCFDDVDIPGVRGDSNNDLIKSYNNLISLTIDRKSDVFFKKGYWESLLPGLKNYPKELNMLKNGEVKLKYIERTECFPAYYVKDGKFAFAFSLF